MGPVGGLPEQPMTRQLISPGGKKRAPVEAAGAEPCRLAITNGDTVELDVGKHHRLGVRRSYADQQRERCTTKLHDRRYRISLTCC